MLSSLKCLGTIAGRITSDEQTGVAPAEENA